MEDVILNTADISAADFTGVNASGADCRNIQNIKYAILTNISLNNANFTSTDLSNVDFSTGSNDGRCYFKYRGYFCCRFYWS